MFDTNSAMPLASANSATTTKHQSPFTRHQSLSPAISYSCALYCIFLHFFAFPESSTLFFSVVSALFAKNTRGWGYPHSLLEEKMKTQSANLAVLSLRCSHRTSGGRRCRLSVSDPNSTLCPQHRAEQMEEEATDHYAYLSHNFQYFQTAQGVNFSLMNLYRLLAENRISPRRAAVLSYISSLLLHTLPQIDADKAAGITDPTKPPINVPARDEDAAPADDEDTDLDPDSDSDSDTDPEADTDAHSGTDLDPGPTNTWD